MPKDDLVYAGHMLDKACEALELVAGKSRSDFDGDKSLRLALVYLIQVIGEAARRLSDDFRAKHTGIPWHDIVGMRHKLVHDYWDVDENIVWSVVTNDLQPLVDQLEKIVPEEEDAR